MSVTVLSASLGLVALGVALALAVPVPRKAARAALTTHAACSLGAAGAVACSIGLTLARLWVPAIVLGVLALASVVVCARLACASAPAPRADEGEDDGDGGIGRRLEPRPPAPTAPVGGPPADWTQFDRLRSGWERERELSGV